MQAHFPKCPGVVSVAPYLGIGGVDRGVQNAARVCRMTRINLQPRLAASLQASPVKKKLKDCSITFITREAIKAPAIGFIRYLVARTMGLPLPGLAVTRSIVPSAFPHSHPFPQKTLTTPAWQHDRRESRLLLESWDAETQTVRRTCERRARAQAPACVRSSTKISPASICASLAYTPVALGRSFLLLALKAFPVFSSQIYTTQPQNAMSTLHR